MGGDKRDVEINRTVVEVFAPALSIIRSLPSRLQAILDAHRQEFDKRYDEYYPSMRAYIESKGFPLPPNKDEMYDFFIQDSVDKGLYDKLDENLKETDLLTYAVNAKQKFDTYIVSIVADNNPLELEIEPNNSSTLFLTKDLIYSKYWEYMVEINDRKRSRENTLNWLYNNGISKEEIKGVLPSILNNEDSFFRSTTNNRKFGK